jgi:UDP-2,3-diacylglucosamine hydrolase
MSALLLSDLHLPAEPSPLREGFAHLLAGPARDVDQVWLLGDIFEYWIGDDAGLQDYAAEIAALRALTASGVRVGFMHGNRDFLVGLRFAEATGVELLEDPQLVTLAGQRVLLSHGDRWCTDDRAYQRWRSFSRNPLAQAVFARLPRRWRAAVAGGVRSRSGQEKRHKTNAIMDVNADAIADAFRSSGADCIIHGHTHRPATHALSVDGRAVERIVLPDWTLADMKALRFDGRQFFEVRTR